MAVADPTANQVRYEPQESVNGKNHDGQHHRHRKLKAGGVAGDDWNI
jgi:hypothetical protein